MTQLQQVEFELLKTLDEVCAQLDIPYFLVCGSALGAVKYGGFIPWDDDIDVAMYREDYERFIHEAPMLLPAHMFLQNYHTEPTFPQIYSKLRNSCTTYIEKSAAKLPINHGIFLDVFPLDGYPRNPAVQHILEFRKRLYTSMLYTAYDFPRRGLGKILNILWRILGIHNQTKAIAGKYDCMVKKYPVKGSDRICNHGNWQGKLDYSPAEFFSAGRCVSFENLPVKIPQQYHEYLTRKYGDYTKDLPEDQQSGHHYFTVCDCNRSYTEHIKHKEA